MPLCRYRSGTMPEPAFGWLDQAGKNIAPVNTSLAEILALDPATRTALIERWSAQPGMIGLDSVKLLAPVDRQDIWAAGVTYARSREARMEESTQQDVYDRVYHAARPEIFFKSQPDRCIGPGGTVAIRHDSDWNVPEPELAIVIDSAGQIAGYTVGNDVSSRSIEGENPLYLPQAKVYADSCAVGPWIVFTNEISNPLELGISLTIHRPPATEALWSGEASTSQLHRTLEELAHCLYDALEFPDGAVLLTGTCIVPPAEFTLEVGDVTTITIEGIGTLVNSVRRLSPRTYSVG